MDATDKSRILIVDPRPDDRERFRESLAVVPVEIAESDSAEAALAFVLQQPVDLVLSEIRLPDASGFSVCRRLREQRETKDVPVILTSAWATEMDRILAFESGADDFVAKPFYRRELASRVSALLRRGRSAPGTASRDRGEPRGAPSHSHAAVIVGDERVALTRKEEALLCALVAGKGRVLTREELIQRVWGKRSSPAQRSIDAHIKSLRRKLGRAADAVGTVRGKGYRFTPTADLRFDASDA